MDSILRHISDPNECNRGQWTRNHMEIIVKNYFWLLFLFGHSLIRCLKAISKTLMSPIKRTAFCMYQKFETRSPQTGKPYHAILSQASWLSFSIARAFFLYFPPHEMHPDSDYMPFKHLNDRKCNTFVTLGSSGVHKGDVRNVICGAISRDLPRSGIESGWRCTFPFRELNVWALRFNGLEDN